MNKLALDGITAAEAHPVSLIIQIFEQLRRPEAQRTNAEVSDEADELYQKYLKKFVLNQEVRRTIEDYLREGKHLGEHDGLVRSRTVAKVDSIGLVVRRWIQCSAGKS